MFYIKFLPPKKLRKSMSSIKKGLPFIQGSVFSLDSGSPTHNMGQNTITLQSDSSETDGRVTASLRTYYVSSQKQLHRNLLNSNYL